MIRQETNNIRINIDKYYFDVDGQLIAGSTLPANLQTKIPWFCFSKFDLDCNYRNASKIITAAPWQFIGAYNRAEVRFLFTGFNTFQSRMQNGDLTLLFTDNIINPSYYSMIVLSSQGGGLSGIIRNSKFSSPYFNLNSANPLEDYLESLVFGAVSRFGNAIEHDSLPLSKYYNPSSRPDNDKLTINYPFINDNQNFLGGYINFSSTGYYVDFRRIKY